MKKLLLIATYFVVGFSSFAQVAIGTTTPAASAVLDLTSTDKALLLPRVANTAAITTPVDGMLIYDISTNCLKSYQNGAWTGCMTFAPNPASFYPLGSVFCESEPTIIVDVLSPTGKIWMDRNLGASRAAISATDVDSYGDLYQWGRFSDGHQCRTSGTTQTLSSSDTPGNSNFITIVDGNYDWRSEQNDNLWQGVNGINNPCPKGYRVPTATELDAERAIFSTPNAAGAFASVLKLPMPGHRHHGDALLMIPGSVGHYWSNTVSGIWGTDLGFNDSWIDIFSAERRSYGFSVRCIKE